MKRAATARHAFPLQTMVPVLDRTVARALAENVGHEHRLAFARSLTISAVRAFCSALGPSATFVDVPHDSPLIPLSPEAARAAQEFGTALTQVQRAQAVYLLGCIYTSALPSNFRAAHGIFYTPQRWCAIRSTWRKNWASI